MAVVSVLKDEEALAAAAAERITLLIEQAIQARGQVRVCLVGGSTPRRLYALLADAGRPWRSRIEWTRVHVFWGDERHVPPDHPDSNFGMAERTLLAHVPIPSNQIHRMRGELPNAADAARDYERVLPQTFDIMLLGLGEDGHIASIFPGSPLLDRGSLVAAVWVAHLNAWRITLTPAAVLDSRAIRMLVSGDEKAPAVRAAIEGPLDVARWPAQILRAADDRIEWLMDAAAARWLDAPPSSPSSSRR